MRHDTRYDKLDVLDNYDLVHESQDIRGRPLVDTDGRRLGIIKDMLVDPGQNRVAAIRLEDGRVTPIDPLEIHDNAVVYGKEARTHAETGVADGTHAETGFADGTNAETGVADGVVEEEVVPVVEERVTIGKRVADHGREIHVRTRVIEEKVSEDVHLRDENVSVDRRPVDSRISADKADALLKGDRTVTMTEHEEEVVVAKDAVVTDEVVVRKTADDRVERVEETVRKTDVEVDRDGSTRRR